MRLGAGRKPKTAAEKPEYERGGQPLGTVARVAILRFLGPRRRR